MTRIAKVCHRFKPNKNRKCKICGGTEYQLHGCVDIPRYMVYQDKKGGD